MVAALAAEGDTFIGECHHIERGYEDICRDMAALAPISAGWGRTPDGQKKFPQTGAILWQGRMILPGEVLYEKLW